MSTVIHPKTGEEWRSEVYPDVFCADGEEHDREVVVESWAGTDWRCKRCGHEWGCWIA